MNWLFLVAGVLFEVAGTTAMKASGGFTRIMPSVLIFICYGIAFALVNLAVRTIEIGVAYAVWSGLGTALIIAIGVIYFDEKASFLKLTSAGLVVLGIAGLKLSSH